MCHLCDPADVGHVPLGVAQRLGIDQLGIRLDGRRDFLGHGVLYKGHLNAHLRQCIAE